VLGQSGCDDYFNLTDSSRNVDHGTGDYCDKSSNLPSWADTSPGWKGSNWYRFTSGAGVMMPESSPGHDHCGTSLSGWLQGTHPTDINVPKQAKVCFHYWRTGDECYESQNILVNNCGDYYVYYLPEISWCELRYCGADQL